MRFPPRWLERYMLWVAKHPVCFVLSVLLLFFIVDIGRLALAAPDVHVVDITTQATGLVQRAYSTPVDQGAATGNCPHVPPDCNFASGQLSSYWQFIDWPEWPYWAMNISVGCGGYCSSCSGHGWIACDIQDAFVGIGPPQGLIAADAGHFYNKTFEIVAEGIYAERMNPDVPHPEWFGPFLMVPKLSDITYDDPALDWVHPIPNAVWWFSTMSNHDGFNDDGSQDLGRYPDMRMSGTGWEPICEILQDAYAHVTSLGVYVEWGCPTDFTLDGRTNVNDLLFLLENWGAPFDVADFLAVLARWGGCPYTMPPPSYPLTDDWI